MATCGTVRLVPGPIGPPGTDATDGTNGVNAYTTLTAAFTMPAEAATATATVADTSWMVVGNVYYLQGCGWLQVTAIGSGTSVTLQNIESTAAGTYSANVPPGTMIAIGNKLVSAGIQGPTGAAGNAPIDAQYLVATANGTLTAEVNLGALASGFIYGTVAAGVSSISAITRGVADTNIAPVDDVAGLTAGEAVFSTATGLESQAPATARTSLGLAIGTNVQAYDAFLTSIAALGTVADRIIYTTGVDTAAESAITAAGRALIDDATVAAQRVTLGVLSGYGLLGSVTGVDLNTGATDTAITMNSTNYIVRRIVFTNASINLTTATAGVFNAAGGVGTIAGDQVLSTLTASGLFLDLTLGAPGTTTRQTAAQLQVRCGTPQGAAATADCYVFGEKLD